MTDEEVAEKINQAISTGEQFSQRYYKILDQERHKINSLYHEEAVLAWNGTAVEGIASIKTFLMDKLPKTNTFLNCLDAQPVHDSAVAGQITILVTVSGTMKLGGGAPKAFQQNFLLTAKENKWKVVTDTFRSQ